MLNSSIGMLCGNKSIELKVKNPEKYGWKPKDLLNQIIDVYLNMRHKKFYHFLASDEVFA